MPDTPYRTALIVGVGGGVSASVARIFAKAGIKIALASRRVTELAALAKEVGGEAFACDVTKRGDVVRLFGEVERAFGAPDVVVYNPSYRTRGPFIELDPAEVEKTLTVSAFGGFLVAQEAVKRMLPHKHGAILFTGASAALRGKAAFAAFAAAKAGLRMVSQSFAREFGPRGIHVAHAIIDGLIEGDKIFSVVPDIAQRKGPDGLLDPNAIAEGYWYLHTQHRSVWSQEIDFRPHAEAF